MTTRWGLGIAVVATMAGACIQADDDGPYIPPDADGDATFLDAPVPIDAFLPTDAPPIDAPPGSNAGFNTPTSVTKANTFSSGVWTEAGDADWSCLGTATTDAPSTGSVTVTGRVGDFQTGNGVGAATIVGWGPTAANPLGTTLSSNMAGSRGDYTLTLGMLPAGTRRYGYTISAGQYLTTHVLHRYIPPSGTNTDAPEVMSEATATALPAFIGITRDETKGMVIGSLRDCQGRAVSHAAVVVSTAATAVAGSTGTTFYFSAGSSSLPVRHNIAPVMNKDGLFVVLQLDPEVQRFVQVWGFRTTAELATGTMTLLAVQGFPVIANEAASVDLEARRL